ncbi:MAG: hypothetical protein JWO03_521 [Bacteroidetes bacterium]|nr:hypothetical protein [Bacteroidota bacterium]
MTRAELKSLSKIRLKEAKILKDNGCYEGAAYLTGYSLELALKARICKILDADYPDTGDLGKVYKTHNFDQLIRLGGIRKKFDDKAAADPDFQLNYSTINGWNESWRYESGKTVLFVEKLLVALENPGNGILSWLKKIW